MSKYELISTLIIIIELAIIVFLLRRGSSKNITKLKADRKHALKHIDDNLQTIVNLEKEKREIKDEAEKIDTADDAFKFLENIKHRD